MRLPLLLVALLLAGCGVTKPSPYFMVGQEKVRYDLNHTTWLHLGATAAQSAGTELLLREAAPNLTDRQRYHAAAWSCAAIWWGKGLWVDKHADALDALADAVGCFGGPYLSQRYIVAPVSIGGAAGLAVTVPLQ